MRTTTNFQSTYPPLLTKRGIALFIGLVLIGLVFFTTQMTIAYSEDIFNKNLEAKVLFQLFLFMFGSFLITALPFTLLAVAILYHSLARKGYSIKTILKKDIIVITLLSFFVGVYAAFILPKANLKFKSLLYDIRKKSPEGELKRTDTDLFKNHRTMQTLPVLIAYNDSLKRVSQRTESNLMQDRQLKEITKNKVETWKIISAPFIFFLLSILGALLGALFYDLPKAALLVLLIIILSIWYFLNFYKDKLALTGTLDPSVGALGLLFLLSMFTLICWSFLKNMKTE